MGLKFILPPLFQIGASSIGAILVYDITRRSSFESLSKWLSEIQAYSHEKIELMIIGNKYDLFDK